MEMWRGGDGSRIKLTFFREDTRCFTCFAVVCCLGMGVCVQSVSALLRRLHRVAVALELFGDKEGQFQRLFAVQARVAMGVIAR